MTALRTLLRRARRFVVQARGQVAASLPGAFDRHVDSWRNDDVARQMEELAGRQLERPDDVAPFRAFLELLPVLVADPELPGPGRFLDIGCGVGAYGELLARYARERFDYVGADYSEEVLAAARRRAPQSTFERRDLFAPGAVDGFDVVFASALLDVLPDPDRALRTLLGTDSRWVFVHRQRIGRGHVGVVPGYRGQKTYSATLSRADLAAAAAEAGRSLAAEAHVDGDVWSFLLRRDAC